MISIEIKPKITIDSGEYFEISACLSASFGIPCDGGIIFYRDKPWDHMEKDLARLSIEHPVCFKVDLGCCWFMVNDGHYNEPGNYYRWNGNLSDSWDWETKEDLK